MQSKQLLQTAYVLHARDYRDSSLLLDCFTQAHGIVNLIAKGARRPQSKIRSVLSPFRQLSLSWASRASDLYTLIDVEESNENSIQLTGDALYCGFYLNELIVKLLHPHDPHPELFQEYQTTMTLLGRGASIEKVLRVFEKRLLDHIGYGLNLAFDARSNQAISADCFYEYHFNEGPVLSGESALTFSGRCLLALANEDLQDPLIMKECKKLMRHVLNHHLGHRPLKSRELLINHF